VTEITISGAGNVDSENVYVDEKGDLYYNVLFEKIPEVPGDWTTAGKPLEAKRWPTGETVLNLNGFNFKPSNYNPFNAAPSGSSNVVGGTPTGTSPALSSNVNDPPPDYSPALEEAIPAPPVSNVDPSPLLAERTPGGAPVNGEQFTQEQQALNAQLAQEAEEETAEAATAIEPPLEAPINSSAQEATATQQPPLANEIQTDGRLDNTASEVDAESVEGLTGEPTDALNNELAEDALPVAGAEAVEATNLANDDSVNVDGMADTIGQTNDGADSGDGGTKGSTSVGDPNIKISGGVSPLPDEFLAEIIPKPNPFKGFATMTYSVSLYILGDKQFGDYIENGIKSVKGLPLLIQSGGAGTVNKEDAHGAIRSEQFGLDFYLDNFELTGYITGQQTGGANNQFELKFTVQEPNGITFLDKLHAAVTDWNRKIGRENEQIVYHSQMFLMVVRFYGYDINGYIVDGSKISKQEPTSDPRAIVEKFIPFRLTNVQFTMQNEMIQYMCEGASPHSFYSTAPTHSAIPFSIELRGGTVEEALSGVRQTTNTSGAVNNSERPGDTAQSQQNQPTPSAISSGLAKALNDEQARRVATGKQTYAHQYVIEFEKNSQIGESKIIFNGSTNKNRTPMDDQKPKLPGSDKVDKDNRIITIASGQSIIQVIDQVVRNSEFIDSQKNIEIDEETGKPRVKDSTAKKVFQWFKISTSAVPISNKIDPITKDYAYRITYHVSRFSANVKSYYFPNQIYRGVHKRYPYWFTGENTEVLDFRQEFNYLYFQQYGDGSIPKNMPEINTIHVANNFYMPNSTESTFGGTNGINDASASVASLLYSPGDQAIASLEIVGDPDWMSQAEIFYSPKVIEEQSGKKPFLRDGSMNYNASEVYFSVEYNTPEDYGNNGLIEIGKDNPYKANSAGKPGQPSAKVSLAYRANKVTTTLSGGRFTQKIEGSLMTWHDDEDVTKVDGGFVVSQEAKRKKREADVQEQLKAQNKDNEAAEVSKSQDKMAASPKTDADFDPQPSESASDTDVAIDSEPTQDTNVPDQEPAPANPDEVPTAELSTEPPLTNTETETEKGISPTTQAEDQTTEPVAKDITPAQSNNTNNPVPQPKKSGPGWSEPEVSGTPPRVPDTVKPQGFDNDDGQTWYTAADGSEFPANSQGALEAQASAYSGGPAPPFEDYSGLYETRVKYKWRPDLGEYEETEYYDEDAGVWKKFAPL